MRIMAHELAVAQNADRKDVQRSSMTPDQLWRIELVHDAMRASGLNQKELSMRIGIHPAHVNRWIHGVRPVPDRWVESLIGVMEARYDY